jgi:peptidoglycan/LPS O-acetylase OafA/YrhL
MHEIEKAFHRSTQNGEYIGFVDGFRFLAITSVVLFHLTALFHERYPCASAHFPFTWLPSFGATGGRGVDLFFILSAFILGLNAKKRDGKPLSLSSFYVRRLRRIVPPFLLAMSLIFIGNVWVTKQFTFQELWPSYLATVSYTYGILSSYFSMPVLSTVTWTLEVEIQFYLVFPLLARIYSFPATTRNYLFLIGSMVAVLCQWYFPLPFVSLYDFLPHFLIGMFLADWYYHNGRMVGFHPLLTGIIAIVSFCCIFYYEPDFHASLLRSLTYPFLLLAFFSFSISSEVVRKILSQKYVCLIGGMCYSIYLLHTPIISILGKFWRTIPLFPLASLNEFFWASLMIATILVSSSLFYLYVEKPFMSSK